jgi:quercetin dioxygenase-like cupin family protein
MAQRAGQKANQPQEIKRTILQKSDVSGTNYETVFGIAEIAPNTDFTSHTHPGTESGYLLEGSMVHIVEGQPAREAKAGDSVLILPGVPHSGRAGPNGPKIVSAWVVEKGKSLASAAKPSTEAEGDERAGRP